MKNLSAWLMHCDISVGSGEPQKVSKDMIPSDLQAKGSKKNKGGST